jgi:hypothetical protein
VSESSERTLLLVLGRRSGTSAVTGALSELGFLVPPPEVAADETNPRGFGESRWVVDLHDRLLRDAGVAVFDARPAGWAEAADVAARADVRAELDELLAEQFGAAAALVVKDPRLVWFLPAWQRAGEAAGAKVAVVTMLRHPAEVAASAQKWYAGWGHTDANRAAAWLNTTLHGELLTRDVKRTYLRYADLLADGPGVLARIGDDLDLAPVRGASEDQRRRSREFLDPGLRRSATDWAALAVPEPVQALAEEVFKKVGALGDPGGDTAEARTALDDARAAYDRLYEDAQAIVGQPVSRSKTRRRPAASPATSPAAPSPAAQRKEALRSLYFSFPRSARLRIPKSVRRRLKSLLRGGGA